MKIDQITSATSTQYIGIDVSKDTLEIHGIPRLTQVPNSPVGYRKIISQALKGSHVILEATGGYEKALWLALLGKDISVSRINPTRIRDLAKSVGQVAKTDEIDAKMIAFYGEKLTPRADAKPSEYQLKLEAVVQARQQLICSRSTQLTQIKQHTDKVILRIFTQVIAHLTKQIKKLDEQITQQLKQPHYQAQAARLETISGVGPITIATLFATMPELGQLSGNQAAALVGVAPHNSDSAKISKKRHIRGGRARIRKVLYMSATTAIRFNPILKALYQRLTERGKAHKIAMVAIMRKLIVLLNRLLRDENFKPA